MPANPYANYLTNAINTASKEELTLMLYEGALKFTNQAIEAVQNKQVEKANQLIVRVQDIIREFQLTLNQSYEISKNFAALYDYIFNRLIDANIKKDVEILMEVRDLLRDFRDTWKEAMKIARAETGASVPVH